MASKAGILTAVEKMVRLDGPAIIQGSLDAYLDDAVRQYGRDKPFADVVDVTGEDASLMTTPTGWVDGSSLVTQFAYPYEDEDSTLYDSISDYLVIERIPGTPVVEKIRFLSLEPASTEEVRVWFSRPHTCSDTVCTVYDADESAVAHLVSSKIEAAKASHYLALLDSGVQADLVDYGQKASEARALSRAHQKGYEAGIGMSENVRAAAVAGDMDTQPQYPGVSHMTHHWSTSR